MPRGSVSIHRRYFHRLDFAIQVHVQMIHILCVWLKENVGRHYHSHMVAERD